MSLILTAAAIGTALFVAPAAKKSKPKPERIVQIQEDIARRVARRQARLQSQRSR